MKRLALLFMLCAFAADAAPWSTRWLVTGRKSEPAIYTITLFSSTQQSLPARILGAHLIWRTSLSNIFNAAALAPLSEVQINIQPVAGAAANALTLRTTWTVSSTEWTANGGGSGYPFRIAFSPDAQAGVDASSIFDLFLNDATVWATLATGTQVYVDVGACVSTCLSGL